MAHNRLAKRESTVNERNSGRTERRISRPVLGGPAKGGKRMETNWMWYASLIYKGS